MDSDSYTIGFVAVFVGILLVTLVVWKTWKPKQPEKYSRKNIKNKKKKKKENFILADESFYIYNYLKKPIRLEVLSSDDGGVTTKKPETLVEDIPAGGKAKLNKAQVDYYMRRGHHVKVYVKGVERPGQISQEELYADNVFSLLPKDKTIKNLCIGMITSRWVQTNAADTNNWALPNAVQGLPWVKIHNFTDRYIALNNNINMAPRSILRYSGRHNFGVPLGTIFKDPSGIHPDYQYTVPNTDIYYGVISDVEQPLSGGWQLDTIFQDDNFEPQWLLQNGWVGGPSKGNIPIGYLPRNGPPVPDVNEWGEVLSEPGKLFQGHFPADDNSLDALPSKCAMRIAQA
jgi:hypothetical protein